MSRAGVDVGGPEHLDSAHDLAEFDPGASVQGDWLAKRALADQETGAARTYVISAAGRVVGYYTLATGVVAQQRATGRVRRNRPEPIPVMILGRLAVDKAFQGRGYGAALLRDAVLRTQQAAAIGGIRAIVLHAVSEGAKRFYEHCGFSPSPLDPMTLMIGVSDIERILRDR